LFKIIHVFDQKKQDNILSQIFLWHFNGMSQEASSAPSLSSSKNTTIFGHGGLLEGGYLEAAAGNYNCHQPGGIVVVDQTDKDIKKSDHNLQS